MTPQEFIQRIEQSTAHAGLPTTRQQLSGTEVLVARTSQFRWRWFATKLHTFLIAAPFAPGTAEPDQLDRFLRAAINYAKAKKDGWPLNLQTGVAVLAVAVTEKADQAAHNWARTPHGRQLGVVAFPVLADTATEQVVRPERMVIGGVYTRHLEGLVDQHVAGPMHWRPVE